MKSCVLSLMYIIWSQFLTVLWFGEMDSDYD